MTAATVPTGCILTGIASIEVNENDRAVLAPNPFNGSTTITINSATAANNSELSVYSLIGTLVLTKNLNSSITTLDINLPSGVYWYKVVDKNNNTQTGKMISQH